MSRLQRKRLTSADGELPIALVIESRRLRAESIGTALSSSAVRASPRGEGHMGAMPCGLLGSLSAQGRIPLPAAQYAIPARVRASAHRHPQKSQNDGRDVLAQELHQDGGGEHQDDLEQSFG